MALLKIVRDSGYADRLRDYKVVLDGKEAGKVANGETIEFPIPAGQHSLSLKIDWCGSNTIQFTALEEDVITFDARSNLRGSRILATLWFALFASNSYIVLNIRSKDPYRQPALP
jgi:hypothetical protein